jgi:hypothetical protein
MTDQDNNEVCILFYSKEEPLSLKFKDQLKSEKNVRVLCVDNNDLRKRIIDSPNYDIKDVPCILEIFQNGNDNIIKSSECLDWFRNFKSKQQENNRRSSIFDERLTYSSSLNASAPPSTDVTTIATTNTNTNTTTTIANVPSKRQEDTIQPSTSNLSVKQLSEQLMQERETMK